MLNQHHCDGRVAGLYTMSRRGGASVQPLKEIEAAVIGDFVPVEAIEVTFIDSYYSCGRCRSLIFPYMYMYICTVCIGDREGVQAACDGGESE